MERKILVMGGGCEVVKDKLAEAAIVTRMADQVAIVLSTPPSKLRDIDVPLWVKQLDIGTANQLEKEYELILQKKSRLSANNRSKIEKLVEELKRQKRL